MTTTNKKDFAKLLNGEEITDEEIKQAKELGNINFDLLCEESMQELKRINEILNRIKDNPEMILKDIYKDNSLTNTIKTFGKKYTLHDFQKYLYNLLIPFFKKSLDNECSFTYNTSTYPALIKITYQKYDLAFVDIQNQVLTLCYPLDIDIHKKNLDSFTETLEKKKKLLIKFKEAGMNPFKLCENNIIKFFNIVLNYNKIKNKRQNILNQLNKEIKLYEEKINELKNKIKEEEMIEEMIENCTQELITFFTNYDYICREL